LLWSFCYSLVLLEDFVLSSAVQNCSCFVLHAHIWWLHCFIALEIVGRILCSWILFLDIHVEKFQQGQVSGLQISSGSTSSMDFVFPYNVLPNMFTLSVYIHRNSTLGKPYGIIKPRCCWEHLRECIWEQFGNLMGTCWEHIGNKGKWKKTISSQNCLSLFLSYAYSRGRILET
jgi:hypothetical protein